MTSLRFGVAAAGLAAFALWFFIGRDSFLDFAHYGTAVPMFGLIVVVALVNAAKVDEFVAEGGTLTVGRAGTYKKAYRAIAYFMGVVIGGALVLFVVKAATDSQPFAHWVFVVEALCSRPSRRSVLDPPVRRGRRAGSGQPRASWKTSTTCVRVLARSACDADQ